MEPTNNFLSENKGFFKKLQEDEKKCYTFSIQLSLTGMGAAG